MKEMRAHVRFDFEKEIEYIIDHDRSKKTYKGITINISEAGLGLFVFNPLLKGQDVKIKSDVRELNRRGNVRWCNEMGDNIYKIGLQFV